MSPIFDGIAYFTVKVDGTEYAIKHPIDRQDGTRVDNIPIDEISINDTLLNDISINDIYIEMQTVPSALKFIHNTNDAKDFTNHIIDTKTKLIMPRVKHNSKTFATNDGQHQPHRYINIGIVVTKLLEYFGNDNKPLFNTTLRKILGSYFDYSNNYTNEDSPLSFVYNPNTYRNNN